MEFDRVDFPPLHQRVQKLPHIIFGDFSRHKCFVA
jgi:hypothetical protein